jgi:hypothetical protein
VGAAGGSITDDFDNDGFLDVVETSFDPCQPMRAFRNNGDGTFSDVSTRSHLAEQLGGINAVQTDYNNDGLLDIFVMRGGWEWPMRNSLLRNNGDGTFSDVTLEAGLLSIDHQHIPRRGPTSIMTVGWMSSLDTRIHRASFSETRVTAPLKMSPRARV